MTTPLTVIEYGAAPPPSFQTVVYSAFDFETTVARLKEVIAAQDLWLIAEINPRVLLERGGYAIHATRQLLFFHPRYMARLLAIDANALVEVPLKIVVMQMADGTVSVRHPDVRMLLGRYAGLDALAEELAELSTRLVRSVSGPG